MIDWVFASCDDSYLLKYGESFVNSVKKVGNVPRLHIVNPSPQGGELLQKLDINFTTEQLPFLGHAELMRTYYSINRFMVVPKLMEERPGDRYLILDIDGIVKKKLKFPKKKIGLYFRNPEDTNPSNSWEREGMNIGAGVVYYGKGGESFAKNVAKRIGESVSSTGLVWFTDQVCLWRDYQAVENKEDCHHFDKDYINWDFDAKGCSVYTAKGGLKEDPRYLRMKEEYETLHTDQQVSQ